MTHRLLVTAGGGVSGPDALIPYDFPTSAPFNVPIYAITPTPDGTGRALHPDVVVFAEPWNGWRFWMAVTPYPPDDREENPSILCSRDGYQWHVPAGGSNPVFPWPGQGTDNANWYNSDTDMIYDPATDELVMIWREVFTDVYEKIWLSASGDGITWSEPAEIMHIDGDTEGLVVSPSLVRVAANDWRLYAVHAGADERAWYATDREGPYGDPDDLTTLKSGVDFPVYHGDWIRHGGRWLAVLHSVETGCDYAAVSADGLAWTVNPAPVVGIGAADRWDPSGTYRPTMQVDPSGDFAHVWYSVLAGPFSCRVGYTRVPMSFWPAP